MSKGSELLSTVLSQWGAVYACRHNRASGSLCQLALTSLFDRPGQNSFCRVIAERDGLSWLFDVSSEDLYCNQKPLTSKTCATRVADEDDSHSRCGAESDEGKA
jgi:hypothetical protein